MTAMSKPIDILSFHGNSSPKGRVTDYITTNLRLHDHLEKDAVLYVTSLSRYPVILGIPWLKRHDPEVSYAKGTMKFSSEFCRTHCNTPLQPTTVKALPDVPK